MVRDSLVTGTLRTVAMAREMEKYDRGEKTPDEYPEIGIPTDNEWWYSVVNESRRENNAGQH